VKADQVERTKQRKIVAISFFCGVAVIYLVLFLNLGLVRFEWLFTSVWAMLCFLWQWRIDAKE